MRRNFKVLLVFAFSWIFVVIYFIQSDKQPKVRVNTCALPLDLCNSGYLLIFSYLPLGLIDFMNENGIIQCEYNVVIEVKEIYFKMCLCNLLINEKVTNIYTYINENINIILK